mmetsp:Transcript_51115/g.81733  ORF Transcript_51115/g.81733 Transcript_51115/m.81733 type:complete len:204 (-) Transcript_51115:138-749(-)
MEVSRLQHRGSQFAALVLLLDSPEGDGLEALLGLLGHRHQGVVHIDLVTHGLVHLQPLPQAIREEAPALREVDDRTFSITTLDHMGLSQSQQLSSHVDRRLRVGHILVGVDGEDRSRGLPPSAHGRSGHRRGLVGGDHFEGRAVPERRPLRQEVDGGHQVETGVLPSTRIGIAFKFGSRASQGCPIKTCELRYPGQYKNDQQH